jgi:hypothetical protein
MSTSPSPTDPAEIRLQRTSAISATVFVTRHGAAQFVTALTELIAEGESELAPLFFDGRLVGSRGKSALMSLKLAWAAGHDARLVRSARGATLELSRYDEDAESLREMFEYAGTNGHFEVAELILVAVPKQRHLVQIHGRLEPASPAS